MSEVMQNELKEIGRWLNRLRFKTVWKQYMNGDLGYIGFKDRVFKMANDIREVRGTRLLTYERFDEGWQYRTVGHENYKIALVEMVNLVFGWW